jgi:hypothetical protein
MPNLSSQQNVALKDAIQSYFDAMYICDLNLLDKVFHPAASLFDADSGDIFVDPISNYREVIAKRIPPASTGRPRSDHILLIDQLSDYSAIVKVRLRIHQNIFVDHLSFACGSHGWQIVAKVWHLESVLHNDA